VDENTRVCPFCGAPPGAGVFCAACGRNLSEIARLPTAAEWAGATANAGEPLPQRAADATADAAEPLPQRAADATAAFLEAMRAAGNPGATELPLGKPPSFRRARRVRAWVVRPVEREDFEKPVRYEPGLVLTVEGRFHRLDSELRGWGQRDFPHYHHTASPDPVDPPVEQWLIDALAQLRAEHAPPERRVP
jgi:hypothetical protein